MSKGVDKATFLQFFSEVNVHMPQKEGEMLAPPKFFGIRTPRCRFRRGLAPAGSCEAW